MYQNKTVKMMHILEPPHQLRMSFDEEQLHELAASMQQTGLINPITIHQDEEGKLIIIAGHRRFLAAKILKWETIAARIKKGENKTGIKIIAAIENLQRANLNIIEEADLVGDLHYEDKLSIGEIEGMLNRKKGWVQSRLEVRMFPPEVLEALQQKTIKFGVSRLIAAIREDVFRKWILDMAINSGATEKMVATWIQDHNMTLTTEDAQNIIDKQSFTTEEYYQKTKFDCGLCYNDDTLENVMIVRVCKACYLELEKLKAQHEIGKRQQSTDAAAEE